MRRRINHLLLFLIAFLFVACDESNCTLQNTIALQCGFYQGGSRVAISDTLTVTVAGSDSVLVNRSLRTSQLTLPMSFWASCDTLIFTVTDAESDTCVDTLWIEKTNEPHFESPDCPSYMFHRITSLRSTHEFIDSVCLMGDRVDFSQYEQIQIHLYTAP